METKVQIKSIFGKILFEFEKENNNIKETLTEANLRAANLTEANLRAANLTEANLREANLRAANLRAANLTEADLRGADLRGANLIGANLIGANLGAANLREADLRGANLRGADLRESINIDLAYIPMFCKWANSIMGDKIQIGCKSKTIKEWDTFFDSDEEFSTKRNTQEFKQIQAIFEAYKAYINHLNI